MPVRLLSTLDQLLVCLTATPSPMFVQKDENLNEPEEEGTVKALEFEFWSLNLNELSFYPRIVLYCFLQFCAIRTVIYINFHFSFSPQREKRMKGPHWTILFFSTNFVMNFSRF